MEKFNLLSADLLDIVFEYRNKLYGAYDLRRTYPKRIVYAIGGMMLVCLLFVGGSILARNGNSDRPQDIATDVVLAKFDEPQPQEPPPPPPPPKPVEPPPQIEMARVTPPLIVPDEQVKPDDEVKPVEALDNVKISTINKEGIENDDIIAPPVEKTTGIANAPNVEKDIDKIFITVQREAKFIGDTEAWAKFLRKNLNAGLPADHGAPIGKYTVIVSFVVDRNGFISDIQAENDPGYGTKAEAIRVIQKSPVWEPAEQNGIKVKYRQRQSITFQVVEE